jgi:hypothetical protein
VTTNNSKSRRAGVIALIAVGAAGLSMAAASQLSLSWTGNFQAGSVAVNADCQTSATPITAKFSTPAFAGSQSLPWSVANVTFSGIDTACQSKSYQAAYKLATGDWVAFAAAGTIGASATSVSVALPAGVDVQAIKNVALTIYS